MIKGKAFSPPRYENTKINTDKWFLILPLCLWGNYFPVFSGLTFSYLGNTQQYASRWPESLYFNIAIRSLSPSTIFITDPVLRVSALPFVPIRSPVVIILPCWIFSANRVSARNCGMSGKASAMGMICPDSSALFLNFVSSGDSCFFNLT